MQDTRRNRSGPASATALWKEWKSFQEGAALISSWSDAWTFSARGPLCGAPGSSFYTNLSFFLRHRSVPLGADGAQRTIYDALVARLGAPPPLVAATAAL